MLLHSTRSVARTLVTLLVVGGCFGSRDDAATRDSSSADLVYATASGSNGEAASGGSVRAGPKPIAPSAAGEPTALDSAHPVIPPITPPRPRADITKPAGVPPTPGELSALAASLVVPVAGVTPSELQGSFHAPRGGGTRRHEALDIPAPRGTPVIAATGGQVLRLFNSKAGGIMIYAADPTERFILMYAHLDRYADGLREGMTLARGQTIGYVGTTGNAPPNVPHLHFAIARTNNVTRWWNGTPVDPAPLFKR